LWSFNPVAGFPENSRVASPKMTKDVPFWRTAGQKAAHADQKKVMLA